MIAVQHRLPLATFPHGRKRSVRRAFHPSNGTEPYRLPYDVRDRLTAALAPYRNRDSAYALAVFLARFWSVPGRVALPFPIDRRALSERENLLILSGSLDLTEARIRGAIRALEEVGFLDRALTSGSTYKPTEHGLRKKPVLFTFGSEYGPLFIAANSRAAAARGRRLGIVKPTGAENARRPPAVNFQGSDAASKRLGVTKFTNSPKSKNSSERSVLMGQLVKGNGIPPKPFEPDTGLEAALARLKQGIRLAEAGGTGGGK